MNGLYASIFRHLIVYEDKSLFTARGPTWHKSDCKKNEIYKDCGMLIKQQLGLKVAITDGSTDMDYIL